MTKTNAVKLPKSVKRFMSTMTSEAKEAYKYAMLDAIRREESFKRSSPKAKEDQSD